MDWKNNLRKASFRKVEFYVESSDFNVSKNQSSGDVPLIKGVSSKKNVSTKDRVVTFNAYVLGDNYFHERDVLIGALEINEPGELIHPYLGPLKVICKEFRVNEINKEGRIARFAITFNNVGDIVFPIVTEDLNKKIIKSTAELKQLIVKEFVDNFVVDGKSKDVTDHAKRTIEGLSARVQNAVKTIRSYGQETIKATFAIRKKFNQAKQLIDTPLNLAKNLVSVYDDIKKMSERSFDLFESYRELAEVQSNLVLGNEEILILTEKEKIKKTNEKALAKLANETVLAHQIELINEVLEKQKEKDDTSAEVNIRFMSNKKSLLIIRKELIESIDDVLENAKDEKYMVLSDIKMQISQVLTAEKLDEIKNVRGLQIQKTTSVLEIAYDIYDDAEESDNIIQKYNIGYPAFVNPGSIEGVV